MTLVKWVSGIIAAIVAVFLLMPQERLDGIKESWRRLTGDPGQACLDFERRNLKDAESARLLTASRDKALHHVTINYKAKNSYGAFVESEVVCWVDDTDGKVNENLTGLVRKTIRSEAQIKLLDADSACLERRNALIHQGVELEEATRAAGGPCDSATR